MACIPLYDTVFFFFFPLTALNICRLFFESQFTVSRFWMSRVSGAGTGTLEEQLGWSK